MRNKSLNFSMMMMLAATMLVSSTAVAAPSGVSSAVKKYTAAFKLKQRIVHIKAGAHAAKRILVPITSESAKLFASTFASGKSHTAILRAYDNDRNHPDMLLDATKGHRFFKAGILDTAAKSLDMKKDGRFIVFKLPKAKMTGLRAFWTTYDPNDGRQALKQDTGLDAKGGCMWWLLNAETAAKADKANPHYLAHDLGVTRSGDPMNLGRKLIHAGNENVVIIGVPVENQKAFDAMTDAQLLNAQPAGGVEAAVKGADFF